MTRWTVFGAGPIGRAIALLAGQSGEVTLVSRSGSGPDVPGVVRVAADASDVEQVGAAARSADVIVNALNPAYDRWPQDWPPMAHALLSAAEASGALLVTVSNLYGYGPVAAPLTEGMSLAAKGSKGRVRARMFEDALAAHQADRLRMVEVRASDYIGPGAESHMGDRIVPRILHHKRSVKVMGRTDQPHTWTYTEDVARLAIAVAADPSSWGRAWHVPSVGPRTQQEVVADLAATASAPTPRVSPYSPGMLWAAGMFSPMIRELRETGYQFDRPFVMDSTAAQDHFGMQPTPWEVTLRETVASYQTAEALVSS